MHARNEAVPRLRTETSKSSNHLSLFLGKGLVLVIEQAKIRFLLEVA